MVFLMWGQKAVRLFLMLVVYLCACPGIILVWFGFWWLWFAVRTCPNLPVKTAIWDSKHQLTSSCLFVCTMPAKPEKTSQKEPSRIQRHVRGGRGWAAKPPTHSHNKTTQSHNNRNRNKNNQNNNNNNMKIYNVGCICSA